jgi:NAD(P)-dependent dehydrogenase (short-subunit alcohol dehydrogenase family)
VRLTHKVSIATGATPGVGPATAWNQDLALSTRPQRRPRQRAGAAVRRDAPGSYPDEIAVVCAFLASEEASRVSGAVIEASAGMAM